MPSETDVAPKAVSGIGLSRKSPSGAMLRSPSVLKIKLWSVLVGSPYNIPPHRISQSASLLLLLLFRYSRKPCHPPLSSALKAKPKAVFIKYLGNKILAF